MKEGSCLYRQDIEHIDIAHLAVADVNEAGNGAPQIEQRVQLDRRLGRAKRCPIEQTQAQVDGAGVQGIDLARDIHIEPQRFVGVEFVGAATQNSCKVGPDTPITSFVGIGQRGASHRLAQSHRVELGGVGTQCDLDVAQGLAPGELRVGHDAKVLGAGQHRNPRIARVARHDACKAGPRHKLHQLGKKRLAKIHWKSRKLSIWGNHQQMQHRNSNRHQNKSPANPRGYWLRVKTELR